MPWDCFCPNCSGGCLGSMQDDADLIEQEQKEFAGKIVHCLSCGTYFEFDTGDIREVVDGI